MVSENRNFETGSKYSTGSNQLNIKIWDMPGIPHYLLDTCSVIFHLCAWMGPLMRVTYSGLTQSVLILDRMYSDFCDCPAKIPVAVDSNANCFTSFNSGSSSPEVAEFCPTLRLVYFIAWA
jgi:hypothetical protein